MRGRPDGLELPGCSPAGCGEREVIGTDADSQGPRLAALVTITVPLATLLGQSGTPGEAGGVGLLDPAPPRTW